MATAAVAPNSRGDDCTCTVAPVTAGDDRGRRLALLGRARVYVCGITPYDTTHGGAKMAKSTGNLVFVHDLLERWSPAALRLAIVGRRWWEDWSFGEQLLAAGEEQAHRLRAAAARPATPAGYDAALAALVDDLSVPAAIAVAEDAGGAAAEVVIDVLGLHHGEPVRRSPILPYS